MGEQDRGAFSRFSGAVQFCCVLGKFHCFTYGGKKSDMSTELCCWCGNYLYSTQPALILSPVRVPVLSFENLGPCRF